MGWRGLPSVDLLLKYLQYLGLGQAETGDRTLGHHLYEARVRSQSWELKPGTPIWAAGVSNGINYLANGLTLETYFQMIIVGVEGHLASRQEVARNTGKDQSNLYPIEENVFKAPA